MTDEAAFRLHDRLAADTVPVAEGPLSHILLMNDARFPWLILVPRRAGLVEIGDLEAPERALLIEESVVASETLKAVTGCPRTNTAALGNMVPQLHVHVIGRRPDDAAWPGPVWGVGTPEPYDPEALSRLVGTLKATLP
ncbi:MAG: HIT domain-containing protein [Rhodobiaceae bacterium]|nr:HIT domain-containing protein [Rhodobiaceae bacterium]